MDIERRYFFKFALATVYLSYSYQSLKNSSNALVSFLAKFETEIELSSIQDIYTGSDLFEQRLKMLILTAGEKVTERLISTQILTDYQEGKLYNLDNWVVSETEEKIIRLKRKYV